MKKNIKQFGNMLMILSIVFLIARIKKMDIQWSKMLTTAYAFRVILVIVLYTVLILVSFLPWMKLVGLMSGQKDSVKESGYEFLRVFTKSNIMKYIPGNVFQYVGRNEIADILDLSHLKVAAATITEMIMMAFGAGSLSVLLLGAFTFQYFYQRLGRNVLFILAAGILLSCCLLFAFHSQLRSFLSYYFSAVCSKDFLTGVIFCFFFYIAAFLYGGLLYIFVMKGCGSFELNHHIIRLLLGTYTLSWVAGYITPGAPGGMGIREVIMAIVLGSTGLIEEAVIIQSSLLFRLVTVLGDLAAFAVSQLLYRIKERSFGRKKD